MLARKNGREDCSFFMSENERMLPRWGCLDKPFFLITNGLSLKAKGYLQQSQGFSASHWESCLVSAPWRDPTHQRISRLNWHSASYSWYWVTVIHKQKISSPHFCVPIHLVTGDVISCPFKEKRIFAFFWNNSRWNVHIILHTPSNIPTLPNSNDQDTSRTQNRINTI